MKSQGIISLEDTNLDIWMKMSEGHTGAMEVLVKMSDYTDAIDPKCWNKVAHVLALDDMGIRGEKLWTLYHDVCSDNVGRLILLLRANQMGGHVSRGELQSASITGDGFSPEAWTDFLMKVRERLQSFGVDWAF